MLSSENIKLLIYSMHLIILVIGDVYFIDVFPEYCFNLCNSEKEFPGWHSRATCSQSPHNKVIIIINIIDIILAVTNKL